VRWFSIAAIYLLFWVITAFAVMPFGLRTPADDKTATMVPGQADSAPINFRPWTVVKRTTLLATLAFGLFYANWLYGWLSFKDFDFTQWIVPSK
jgi:predicted secreted protein